MPVVEKLHDITDNILREWPDLFVVDVKLKGNKGTQKLLVTLDGDHGVNIDQCAEVSRKLGKTIDEEGLIEDKYILEVSSAGLGAPLQMPRQFQRHQGKKLHLVLNDGRDLKGELISHSDEGISLKVGEKEEFYYFKDIQKSVVEVSFK